MLALADFSNDVGESWPSIPVLAQKARLTERQTRRVLIKLIEAGEIRKVQSNGGRNQRNHYFITVPEYHDNITGKVLLGNNTSEKKYTGFGDTKTLTPMSGALNRHRTVNKERRTESDKQIPSFSAVVNSFPKKSKPGRQPDSAQAETFARFYSAYPKRMGREAAVRAWSKLNPNDKLVAAILTAIENQKRWRAEQAANPKAFIPEWPYPATWLNGKRWEDEPAQSEVVRERKFING
jgi:hypothetical protein